MTDDELMGLALDEARRAAALDEVPVGAIVVIDKQIVARGYNRTITDLDPTAHAEIVALRQAARVIENYRLVGASVYTTLEPCAMCAGALVNARVDRLIFGATDLRFGAVVTAFQLCTSSSLNHRLEIVGGVREAECRELMQAFFKAKRVL